MLRAIAGTATLLTLVTACGSDAASPGSIAALNVVAGVGSAEAHLSQSVDGRPVMSWLEPDDGGVTLRYSLLDEDTWTAPQTVARGNDWFVNWADFPSVVPVDDATWAAHWLRKTPGSPYSYDVMLSLSNDGGSTWADPFPVHDDGTATEHGFVSLFAWDDGVGVTWLDGRNTLGSGPDAAMTLRAARFGKDGRRIADDVVDSWVCDCCQTDVAMSGRDPLVVYRDRTRDEVRDIYVSRFDAGYWSPGNAVADDGWVISGCPVNGPAIAAHGEVVAVAWFTAAKEQGKVRLAFSANGAQTFSAPVDIDIDSPLGRVGLVMLDDGSAVVSWLAESAASAAEVRLMRVSPAGRTGVPVTAATTGSGRLAGFPQLIAHGDQLIVAWTDTADEATQVRSASVPLNILNSAVADVGD